MKNPNRLTINLRQWLVQNSKLSSRRHEALLWSEEKGIWNIIFQTVSPFSCQVEFVLLLYNLTISRLVLRFDWAEINSWLIYFTCWRASCQHKETDHAFCTSKYLANTFVRVETSFCVGSMPLNKWFLTFSSISPSLTSFDMWFP